jgi:very-short-patch-repair endonuclease
MDFKTAYPDSYSVTKENAKTNRSNMTDAESLLWHYLRQEQLGVRFRRQHVIGDYIVDFICLKQRLIIEIDGGYHNDIVQQQEDRIRQNWLESMDYKVIRFTNEEVFYNIETVISTIKGNINLDLPFRV